MVPVATGAHRTGAGRSPPIDRPFPPPALATIQHQGLAPLARFRRLLRFEGQRRSRTGRTSHQAEPPTTEDFHVKAFALSDGRCELAPCCTRRADWWWGDELSSRRSLAAGKPRPDHQRGGPRRSYGSVLGVRGLAPRVAGRGSSCALRLQPGADLEWLPRNWLCLPADCSSSLLPVELAAGRQLD